MRKLEWSGSIPKGIMLVVASFSMSLGSCSSSKSDPVEAGVVVDVTTGATATSSGIDPIVEWSRFSVLFDRPHIEDPIEVDGQFFGIADVRDFDPNLETQGDVILLLRFDGKSYVPLDRYGGGVCFYGDCDFMRVPIETLEDSVLWISFLRESTDGTTSLPLENYLVAIRDNELVSLLPVGATSTTWESVKFTGWTDSGVSTSECSMTDSYNDESGISGPWCLEYIEKDIRFESSNPIVVSERRIANPKPIEACLFSYGEECANSVTIFADPGCPTPKEGKLYEYAVYPCTYSYWVLVAESELSDLGYPVTVDGYYRSTEVEAVKSAQTDFGLTVDGQIGPASWMTMFKELDCRSFDRRTGQPYELQFCYDDWNNDGFYGPGDLIPD